MGARNPHGPLSLDGFMLVSIVYGLPRSTSARLFMVRGQSLNMYSLTFAPFLVEEQPVARLCRIGVFLDLHLPRDPNKINPSDETYPCFWSLTQSLSVLRLVSP